LSRSTLFRAPARGAVLLVALVHRLTPAFAQTPAPPPPPPSHEGSAEFALVGTGGNSSTETVGLGGEFIARPLPWEMDLKAAYVRNEANHVVSAQSLTAAARAQRGLTTHLATYGQYSYLRDRFAGILDRNVMEGGIAYTAAQSSSKLTADAGLGYVNEQRLIAPNLSTATAGAGVKYTLKVSATSELTEDGHVMVSLPDTADWRYANTLALGVKVTSLFSLKLSNTVRFVNRPVAGFKGTDTVTAVALVAKF